MARLEEAAMSASWRADPEAERRQVTLSDAVRVLAGELVDATKHQWRRRPAIDQAVHNRSMIDGRCSICVALDVAVSAIIRAEDL
jgi:hypothetical protein